MREREKRKVIKTWKTASLNNARKKVRTKDYITAIYIYPELNYKSDVILIQRRRRKRMRQTALDCCSAREHRKFVKVTFAEVCFI